jgi:L-lysine 2,3-aminomutase
MTVDEVLQKMRSVKTIKEWEQVNTFLDQYVAAHPESGEVIMEHGESFYMLRGAIEEIERQATLANAS